MIFIDYDSNLFDISHPLYRYSICYILYFIIIYISFHRFMYGITQHLFWRRWLLIDSPYTSEINLGIIMSQSYILIVTSRFEPDYLTFWPSCNSEGGVAALRQGLWRIGFGVKCGNTTVPNTLYTFSNCLNGSTDIANDSKTTNFSCWCLLQ